MVGVGIFIGPPLMAQKAGVASFLGWPVVALIFLPVVLCIAAMARMFPGEGSFFIYNKKTLGETLGFVSGWSYYLVYTFVAAIQTICLRDIVIQYIPMPSLLFNLVFVIFITMVSLFSIRIIGQIQNTGTIFKLLPLLFVLSAFLAYWDKSFHITMQGIRSVPSAVPLAIFGFLGFESCCAVSHLIKGDPKNASRAVLLAFFIVATIYTLFHLGLLHIMGADNLAAEGAEDFVLFMGINSQYIKNTIVSFISLSMSLAFAVSILSMITATSSTVSAMGKNKLVPFAAQLTKKSRSHRPWIAVLVQGVIILGLSYSTNDKNLFISITNLGILVTFFLTLISLIKIQKKHAAYGRMIITLLGFASCTAFTYFSWALLGKTNMTRLIMTTPLIVAILVGLAAFKLRKSKVF
jgi:amino acid transporter